MHNRYLLIRRWQLDVPPKDIRQLKPGSRVRLVSGEEFTVDHVGIHRVLLDNLGWVDWREIDLSAEGR